MSRLFCSARAALLKTEFATYWPKPNSNRIISATSALYVEPPQKEGQIDRANSSCAREGIGELDLNEAKILVAQRNAFKLFGIEQKFKIDEAKLQREMRKLQNKLHPDKFVDKGIETQEISHDLSSLVNDFYDILKNPYERGKYLLSLVTNKSSTEIDEELDKLCVDDEFLAYMMEIREQLDDPNTSETVLTELNSALDSELAKLVSGLSKDFECKNIEAINNKLGKLKFLSNCHKVAADRLGSFSTF